MWLPGEAYQTAMTRQGFWCVLQRPTRARAINKIWGTTRREDAKKRALPCIHSTGRDHCGGSIGTGTSLAMRLAVGHFVMARNWPSSRVTKPWNSFFFLHKWQLPLGLFP